MGAGVAHAADVALGGVTWNTTGAAGLIAGDATVAVSPLNNSTFGYVTTAGGVYNTSPLALRSEGRGTENQTNGTKIVSGSFNALAGEKLNLYFNYVSTDGRGYDDYAWARLVSAGSNTTAAWLFTARSTNSANGSVVPGDVLNRQVDNKLPDQLDAVLNDGKTVSFEVAGTQWAPLGSSSGICWDSANTCGPTGWIKSSFSMTTSGSYYLEFGINNWGDEAYDSALAFDFAGLQPARFNGLTAPVPELPPAAMMGLGLGLMAMIMRRRQTRPSASAAGDEERTTSESASLASAASMWPPLKSRQPSHQYRGGHHRPPWYAHHSLSQQRPPTSRPASQRASELANQPPTSLQTGRQYSAPTSPCTPHRASRPHLI
jgi:hypothetical protein